MRDSTYIRTVMDERDFWDRYEAVRQAEERAERRAKRIRILRATIAASIWLVGIPLLGGFAFGIETFGPIWFVVGNVGAVVLGSRLFDYVKYGGD